MTVYIFLKNTVFLFLFLAISCGSGPGRQEQLKKTTNAELGTELPMVAANQTGKYLPLLKGKNIGMVANQTSVIFKDVGHTHLVDSLLSLDVAIKKVFAPEHGFRGKADAGEEVVDGIDVQTGLPLLSLHGKHKKPTQEQLSGLDLLIFDIQDVGVRFYTYLSTLHYVMEACAEAGIPLLILDRPNPNGHYIDGPTLKMENSSFLGKHPIPLVHGMTIAEYAQMINGEAWLNDSLKCDISIVPVKNYTHQTGYSVPIRPSPNLPNDKAINLYPSLGLFEGTTISAGRGTEMQFQIYGAPFLDSLKNDFRFTPRPNFGSKYPKFDGELCYGKDLGQEAKLSGINLQYLLDAYNSTPDKHAFFKDRGFTIHAGTEELRKQMEAGLSAQGIKASWQEGLEAYKKIRKKYLIYR